MPGIRARASGDARMVVAHRRALVPARQDAHREGRSRMAAHPDLNRELLTGDQSPEGLTPLSGASGARDRAESGEVGYVDLRP